MLEVEFEVEVEEAEGIEVERVNLTWVIKTLLDLLPLNPGDERWPDGNLPEVNVVVNNEVVRLGMEELIDDEGRGRSGDWDWVLVADKDCDAWGKQLTGFKLVIRIK